jgi:gamma-glutamyltranspeptidase / glutathione hydrolase
MATMRPILLICLVSFSALAARPFSGGAVAAAHPMGSAAGREMLDAGGNAIDAAVATAFTMAVVGPYHSGLGGGGFAVIHLAKDGKEFAFDFRELAPLKATREMYLVDGKFVPELATDGVLSIAVPGAVKGYLELHAKYGKLPRAKVLAPAIKAATKGFVVTPKYRDLAQKREACLKTDAEAARIFLREGKAPDLGMTLMQPDLAKTLTALAKQGDAPFYTGSIGKALVAGVASKGGILSLEDLAKYHTTWRAPLEGRYRGHRLITMPPPSAGGLAMLETFGLIEARGVKGPASREVEALHTFIEALRLAYVDRTKFVGDPAFVDVPVSRLTGAAYLGELSTRIDPKKATRSVLLMPKELLPPGAPKDEGAPPKKNTTHISVIDREGNAVALTSTINYYFGSCVVAKGTGILLNDEMDDFTGQPGVPNVFGLVMGEANTIAPGKIPVSSMTPTLVFMKDRDRDVMLAVGSPGGSTIPTTVMQVISNVIDQGLDVSRAVNRGRIHHQWLPDEVWIDQDGLDPATKKALEGMGHTFVFVPGWGDAEAVMVDPVTGLKSAASDPRNEGAPAGQE